MAAARCDGLLEGGGRPRPPGKSALLVSFPCQVSEASRHTASACCRRRARSPAPAPKPDGSAPPFLSSTSELRTASRASSWAAEEFNSSKQDLKLTKAAPNKNCSEGRSERYSEIAAEFVRLKVDVIVASGTPPS